MKDWMLRALLKKYWPFIFDDKYNINTHKYEYKGYAQNNRIYTCESCGSIICFDRNLHINFSKKPDWILDIKACSLLLDTKTIIEDKILEKYPTHSFEYFFVCNNKLLFQCSICNLKIELKSVKDLEHLMLRSCNEEVMHTVLS